MQLLTPIVMTMPERISDHRLGAFIYGFLSGIGLIMIIWGLASITMLPSANLMMNIGFVLFGVTLLACGSCREAYLRGNLSVLPDTHVHAKSRQTIRPTTANLVSEQIIGTPQETDPQKAHEP
jgi:hypothetical protein